MNLIKSLLMHERISTTLARAKEMRSMCEKLITLSKSDTLHSRRRALAFTRGDKLVVNKLFSTLGQRYKLRPGGYLRILKTGPRKGDAADMAIVELV